MYVSLKNKTPGGLTFVLLKNIFETGLLEVLVDYVSLVLRPKRGYYYIVSKENISVICWHIYRPRISPRDKRFFFVLMLWHWHDPRVYTPVTYCRFHSWNTFLEILFTDFYFFLLVGEAPIESTGVLSLFFFCTSKLKVQITLF